VGFLEDESGFARYRRAKARIGSDREARSDTREGACSPQETGGCGLLGGRLLGGFMTVINLNSEVHYPRNTQHT